jgi:hypothetical protein
LRRPRAVVGVSRTRKIKKALRLAGLREADRVIREVGAKYPLDSEDRERIRRWVSAGYAQYRERPRKGADPFSVYVDEMIEKLGEAYDDEYRGRTLSLGPLSAHMLFSICPLWPFC